MIRSEARVSARVRRRGTHEDQEWRQAQRLGNRRNLVMLQLNTPNSMQLTVSVFDISGRLTSVPVQKLNISGESSHAIDFSSLQAGNYYIKLTNSDNKLNQTIKIQKVD
jgi:hypothetical protein